MIAKQPLTDKEAKYLEWVMHRIRCAHSPTYVELAHHFKVSRPAVHKQMQSLVEKGYLQVAMTNQLKHTWTPLVSLYWHIPRET